MLVGYVRVSSSDDRQSTDLQRDALTKAGVDPRNIYEDKSSGARDDRPGLKMCLEYLQGDDVLVVWKLDRLGRSLGHLLQILTGLKRRSVGFRSLTETIDTTTPMGNLLFQLFGALAEYERSLIQERINAGLAAARQRGRVGGRPRIIKREQIATARALLDDGNKTVSEAARAVGVKRSTLADALKRPEENDSDATVEEKDEP